MIFDVLVAVAVKITVFWDVTPCRYVLMFQRNVCEVTQHYIEEDCSNAL